MQRVMHIAQSVFRKRLHIEIRPRIHQIGHEVSLSLWNERDGTPMSQFSVRREVMFVTSDGEYVDESDRLVHMDKMIELGVTRIIDDSIEKASKYDNLTSSFSKRLKFLFKGVV